MQPTTNPADRLQIGPPLVTIAVDSDTRRGPRTIDPPRPIEELRGLVATEFLIERQCGCGTCSQTFTVNVPADSTGRKPSRKGNQRMYVEGHKRLAEGTRTDVGNLVMQNYRQGAGPAMVQAQEMLGLAEVGRASALTAAQNEQVAELLSAVGATGAELVELLERAAYASVSEDVPITGTTAPTRGLGEGDILRLGDHEYEAAEHRLRRV